MHFEIGLVDSVIRKPLRKFHDQRGWLCELFRSDEIPAEFHPAMAYISQTEPGIARGPHEHADQSDCFCFFGPSDFELHLWDNRQGSKTHGVHETILVGEHNPMLVIVPPGVVHAYRNVGTGPGLVFNCPNRLYQGEGKKEPVDEIRHEADPSSPFRM
jgi:dTDP-4-dehydrorhamnose 3,5-epimerase